MSYEEKGVWIYLGVALVTFGIYVGIILGRAGEIPITEVPYVSTMLWMIGLSVLLSVLTRVAVELATPSDMHQADARDKEINRFGEYVGGVVLAIGVLVPLVLAFTEADHFWIANAIYAAFILQAVSSSAVKLYVYRRGL